MKVVGVYFQPDNPVTGVSYVTTVNSLSVFRFVIQTR